MTIEEALAIRYEERMKKAFEFAREQLRQRGFVVDGVPSQSNDSRAPSLYMVVVDHKLFAVSCWTGDWEVWGWINPDMSPTSYWQIHGKDSRVNKRFGPVPKKQKNINKTEMVASNANVS